MLVVNLIIVSSGFIGLLFIYYKRYKLLEDELHMIKDSYRRLEWSNHMLDLELNEYKALMSSNVKVGSIFYTPNDNERYKEDFMGTKQRITSVDYVNNRFNSVDIDTNKGWTINFDCVKDFFWVREENVLKHKFI